MILDGTGGANTLTGHLFEIKTDLYESIKLNGNYMVSEKIFKHNSIREVSSIDKETGNLVLKGYVMQKAGLYHFLLSQFGKPSIPLDEFGNALFKYPLACNSHPVLPLDLHGELVQYKSFRDILSKNIEPDDVFYNIEEDTFYIIEKKKQTTTGSVDEKIRSYRSMMNLYYKLITRSTGSKVNFIYLLSDWFTDKKYFDDLENIEFEGGTYFIEELPISFLGLTEE